MEHEQKLYMTEAGWEPTVNRGDYRLFCHNLAEGEDHYHRITSGEIYLEGDDENVCLKCAKVRGLITAERPSLENQGFVQW